MKALEIEQNSISKEQKSLSRSIWKVLKLIMETFLQIKEGYYV